uniref:transmembrane protein 200A-like n=1 Tax=Myxine glutinosa TaxID=7769 RepID=UPI00358E095D
MPAMIAMGGLLRGFNANRKPDARRAMRASGTTRNRVGKRQGDPLEALLVRPRLRLASLPGLCALLGILVLLLGIGMTVLGYWPSMEEITTLANFSGNYSHLKADIHWSVQPLRHLLRSERAAAVGPLAMGAGLFVFICANALLHEWRDRATRVVVLQDIYSSGRGAEPPQIPESSRDPGERGRQLPLGSIGKVVPSLGSSASIPVCPLPAIELNNLPMEGHVSHQSPQLPVATVHGMSSELGARCVQPQTFPASPPVPRVTFERRQFGSWPTIGGASITCSSLELHIPTPEQ